MSNLLLTIGTAIEVSVQASHTTRPRVHLLIKLIGIGCVLTHVLRVIKSTLTMVTKCCLRTLSDHVLYKSCKFRKVAFILTTYNILTANNVVLVRRLYLNAVVQILRLVVCITHLTLCFVPVGRCNLFQALYLARHRINYTLKISIVNFERSWLHNAFEIMKVITCQISVANILIVDFDHLLFRSIDEFIIFTNYFFI